MRDTDKTREQLIRELAQARRRVAELESAQASPEPEAQDRRDLELAIIAAAREWRTTFDAIHDAVCLLNERCEILRCNRAMVDYLGKPFAEVLGQSCCLLVHGSPEPLETCPTLRAYETGRRETTIMQRGDRWLSFVADPVLDEGGDVTGVVHIIADITERKRAEEALQRHNHELTLLNRATRACSSSLNGSEVLFAILQETRNLLNVVSSSVWLIDGEKGDLVCREATGPYGERLRGWHMPLGEGIVGVVALNDESIIVPDTRLDDRHYKGIDLETGLELRSVIGVPLRVKESVIGVVEVVDSNPDRFGKEDVRLIESLAATAATAIENARLYERAQQEIDQRRIAEAELETAVDELRQALAEVKTLSGLLPICANCKKIRDDQGYWQSVEVYVRDRSDAQFSHGICPDCMRDLYPEFCEDDE